MKENTSPAKSSLSYGIIFGVVMIVEFILMYIMDLDPVQYKWVGMLTNLINFLVLPVLFISLACNNYKKLNSGYITFGEALKAGVGTMALGALIYGVFSIIFNLIFPEFQEQMFEKIKEGMVAQNPDMTKDQLEMGLKWAKTFMNPYVAAPFTILVYTFVGLIYSLIIGAIIKKDNPGAFNQ